MNRPLSSRGLGLRLLQKITRQYSSKGLWIPCVCRHFLQWQIAQVCDACRGHESHKLLFIVHSRCNLGNERAISSLRNRFQRGGSYGPVLVSGCRYQRFSTVRAWIVRQFLCCCRAYGRRIILRYGFEDFVTDSCKGDESNPFLKSKFRHFLLVFESVELSLDQPFVGTPFTCQYVVIDVVTRIIVEQE